MARCSVFLGRSKHDADENPQTMPRRCMFSIRFCSGNAIYNLIEPAGLLQHFAAHPPQDFQIVALPGAIPGFALHFDLTTTMDRSAQQRLAAWPLRRLLRRWLRPYTCFVGATCSEYAPLPIEPEAESLVQTLLREIAPQFSFLILKDLPMHSPLTGEAANRYTQQVISACQQAGFFMVEGQALAYVPIDFASIEEVLARMPRTRRKEMKRKLKARAELEIETLRTGDPYFFDPAHLDLLYQLYANVYQQSEIHFDRLTAEFFRALLQDASLNGSLFLYRAQGEIIGFNLCFEQQGLLLDKYVGFAYPQARAHNLYTVSWFHNLEYALQNNLHTYVAGWTDPEIKRHLGAQFTFTQHAVYIRNPLLRTLLKPLRRWFESDRQWYEAHAPAARS